MENTKNWWSVGVFFLIYSLTDVTLIFSKTIECCEFFDIKNIKTRFTYLEIWIFVIKPTKSVSFDFKRPNRSFKFKAPQKYGMFPRGPDRKIPIIDQCA